MISTGAAGAVIGEKITGLVTLKIHIASSRAEARGGIGGNPAVKKRAGRLIGIPIDRIDVRLDLDRLARCVDGTVIVAAFREVEIRLAGRSWIPERSATRLREADLNVLSKLGK
jgi:hypothetical protein